MNPRLSILICSLECRRTMLDRLRAILEPQATADAEIIVESDNGERTIGEKRTSLLHAASGSFCAFIDDDDTVTPDYIGSLLTALESDPDCVGFRAEWFEDGKKTGDTIYSLSVERNAEKQKNADGLFNIYRKPTHLTPIRTEFARAVGFMPWCYGEDRDYSIRIQPYLKREVFIDRVLYRYWLRNRDTREAERVHPKRWNDDNFRIERSLGRAVETAKRLREQAVPLDTDR